MMLLLIVFYKLLKKIYVYNENYLKNGYNFCRYYIVFEVVQSLYDCLKMFLSLFYRDFYKLIKYCIYNQEKISIKI